MTPRDVASHRCAYRQCDLSSEPPYAFIDAGCIVPAWNGRCRFCGGTDGLMTGDGPVVACRGCAGALGAIICDPESVGAAIHEDLRERHGNVANLVRLINGVRVWRWNGDWPGVEARRVGGA